MAAPKNNKFALGLTDSGRPPIFSSEDELKDKVIAYFDSLEYTIEIDGVEELRYSNPTVTGLALFLGFESRQSIYDYKEKQEFSYIIKRALLVIESHYENNLNTKVSTGAIFALKNMNWKDSSNIDLTSKDKQINNTPTIIFRDYSKDED